MNAPRKTLAFLPFSAFLAVAGCAGGDAGSFPSLLPRAIESRGEAVAVRPDPVATPDAALDTRLAVLGQEIASAQTSFDAVAARAERLARAARGAAQGSDPWLNAQTALAELDVARTAIATPVAALEQMSIDRGVAGVPPYPAIDALLERANAAAAAQRARINAIEAMLA